MSSRRRLRHAPPVKRYDRRDIFLAVALSAAAVVVTGILIWTLRPGGIADRQPRASWLVVLAALALGGYVWWLLRPRSKRRERTVLWLAGGVVLVLAGAVVAGMLWPGGLLRHSPEVDPFTPTPGDIIIDGDTDEPTESTDP